MSARRPRSGAAPTGGAQARGSCGRRGAPARAGGDRGVHARARAGARVRAGRARRGGPGDVSEGSGRRRARGRRERAHGATCASWRRSRSTRRRAQDFDDAISAQRLGPGGGMPEGDGPDSGDAVRGTRPGACACGCTSPTYRRTCPRARPSTGRRAARGTSVYVPGAVEPMLPQALSSDACSLVPGAERAAVTVEMDLRGAEVVRTAFYRSLIRSDARLEYERVDRIFAGHERAEDPWAQPLAAAREVSAAAGQGARTGGRAGARLRGAGDRVRRGRAGQRDTHARADRVAPADRAPDDRRQRSRRAAAGRSAGCRACTASTSAPSPRG